MAAWFYLKKKKQNVRAWFDIGIIGLMIGWAIGRIGCLLNGDSGGFATNSFLAIAGRWPTQLMESSWALIVAVFCFYLFNQRKKFQLVHGQIFIIGIGLYAIGRFFIDFLRDEQRLFLFLKPGQLASLFVITIVAINLYYAYKASKVKNGGREA